jgi:pimeloyl-ACP methyl ester carboxylesterase
VFEPVLGHARRLQDHAALAAIVYRTADSAQVSDPPGWTRSADPLDTVDDRSRGLYYEVWERDGETAVVYRGTEFTSLLDWWSNSRWVTRFLPLGLDQYDAVRRDIHAVVARARARRSGVPLVAVGHSLGGGLAQRAAYAHPDIDKVVAFDPSPVTGFRSVPLPARDTNSVGLSIERVYESGEILAFARGFLRNFIPLSIVNPAIIEIRFNFRGAGVITQHSMVQLAFDLRHAAKDIAEPAARVRKR